MVDSERTKALICQKAGFRIKDAWEHLCGLENNISGPGGTKRRNGKIPNKALIKMMTIDIREAWKYIGELQMYLNTDLLGYTDYRPKPLRKPRKRKSNRENKRSRPKPLRKPKKLSSGNGK